MTIGVKYSYTKNKDALVLGFEDEGIGSYHLKDTPGRSEFLPYRKIQVTKYMLIHVNLRLSLAKGS